MSDRMTCAEAIKLGQLWAARGVPAFPVAIGWDDGKGATSKRPTTDHGHLDATTDPAELERLFNARSPRPGEAWGVGLRPGPAGYAVVDVDIKGGAGGDDTWAALRAEHGEVDTYTVTTATGGLHLWGGKGEHHVGNVHELGPGIDLRSDDGWVVAPGTRTPWGSWDREGSSARWPPAPWPAWVLGRLGATNGNGSGGTGRWQPLDRAALHPLDRETLEVMEERYGAHGAVLGPKGEVRVTRPGNRAGTSATIGHIGPGIVKMMSSNWPPFVLDQRYTLDALIRGSGANGDEVAPVYRSTRLADVEPEEVDWLWPGKLPRGKLVTLFGDPDVGKSTVCIDCAARTTTGQPMPGEDQAYVPPSDVVVMSAEDGLADTVRPRLDAAGADVTRVHHLDAVARYTDDGELAWVPPSIPSDLAALEALIVDTGAVLVIVDVLNAYLAGNHKVTADQDVRRALAPLAAIAERTHACIVLIGHIPKGQRRSGDRIAATGGAMGVVGAARVGMIAAVDPQDETEQRRILARAKGNLAPPWPSLAYTLIPHGGCARVEWLGEVDISGDQLLAERQNDDERSESQMAKDYLMAKLRKDDHLSKEVLEEAREKHGISEKTLRRAGKDIGVGAYQQDRKWWWRRPSDGQMAIHHGWPSEPPEDDNETPDCRFGAGLECLNGDECSNPNHRREAS